MPDGLKVDVNGNVFATGPGGVQVFAPDGTRLGRIITDVPTANVAFGEDGATLFITANHRVLAHAHKTKGMPLPAAAIVRQSFTRGDFMISRRLRSVWSLWPLRRSVVRCRQSPPTKARVLVYSGSTGYRHDSIPAAVEAIKALGAKAGYAVDATEDPEVFTAEKLGYKALVLVSTSTDPKKPESEWFTGAKRDALQGFLKDGKGVVGCMPPAIRTTTGAGTAR